MKTEEQFLLNYMYQKGYTDEDMFDEKLMHSINQSFGFAHYKLKIKAGIAFAALKKIAQEVWAQLTVALEPVYQLISKQQRQNTAHNIAYPSMNSDIQVKIQDQVIDRKPKYLVRKIIH